MPNQAPVRAPPAGSDRGVRARARVSVSEERGRQLGKRCALERVSKRDTR